MAGLIQILGYATLVGAHYERDHMVGYSVVENAVVGLSRGVNFIPFVMVSESFNPKTEQHYLNIWQGLYALGTLFGYGFSYFLIDRFSWHTSLLLMCGLFLLSLVLQHAFVPEVQPKLEPTHELTLSDTACFIKSFLSKPAQALLIVEAGWMILILLNMENWSIYYLTKLGVPHIMYIVGFSGLLDLPGTMLLEFLVAKLRELKGMVTYSFLMLVVAFNLYFAMVPAGAGSEVHYFIIFYGINFFLTGPYSRLSSETIAK